MSNKSNNNRGNQSNSSHGGKPTTESYKPARTGDLVKSQHITNTLPAPGKPGSGGGGGGNSGGNKGK